jgi:hypothetical protein
MKNGCNSDERYSFELSENLPEKLNILFNIPSLRKSQLKFSVFCKILQKITKFMKLSLRLWGHLWYCGAQKCLPMMRIVA